MTINGEHYMDFKATSGYMKLQREKIRKLEFEKNALIFCLIIMFVAFIWGGFKYFNLYEKYVDSQINVESLQQMIEEKNEVIVDQQNTINKQQERVLELETKFYSTVQIAVKDLCGKTIDKAIGTVYLEATNQDEKGMQLVADTIWNREKSEKFKCDSVEDVLSSVKQFSVLDNIDNIPEEKKQTDQYLLASRIVWDKIIYDKTISSEVLFFMNPDISNKSSRGWMRNRQLVIKYKDHEFYK